MTQTLSLSDVATQLSVSLPTVRSWVQSKQLMAVNVSRSQGSQKPRWRVTKQSLDTFLNQRSGGLETPARASEKVS